MRHQTCPLCGRRRGQRACPALGHDICAVCCGTKRMIEIRCLADCSYLRGARAHPPAVVKRQQQRDAQVLALMIHDLTEMQYHVLAILQRTVQQHRATALPPLADVDVADAAQALASTLETAGRGIIYEHQAPSLPAQRLSTGLKGVLETLRGSAGPRLDRDAAVALRRLETGARQAEAILGGGRTAYLDLLDRISRQPSAAAEGEEHAVSGPEGAPRLII